MSWAKSQKGNINVSVENIFPLINLFGTDNFDEIKEDLVVDESETPPVIKYIGKGSDEPIVIAKINIREEGVGYGQSIRFDMSLSNDFAKRCKEAHQTELKQAKRAD